MIRVEDLSVAKGNFTLGKISLDLKPGEYLTLLGPSGAGKTVFLEACMGLHRPQSGRIFLNGQDATWLPPERRGVSYLPQDLALFPHLSVRDNILFGARTRRLDRAESARRLAELVELLDLARAIDRPTVQTLSGGEKQRVALARALMPRPDILFLDEPLSALDAAIKRQLQVKLREVNRSLGVTIIHVTHDQEEAFMLGEKIAVLVSGCIQQVGRRDDIYYRPASLPVARFLRNANIFHLQVEHCLPDGSLHLGAPLNLRANPVAGVTPGQRVVAGIRSEEVMIIRPGRPLAPHLRDNRVFGEVVDILEMGGSHTLFVRPEKTTLVVEVEIPNSAFRDLAVATGRELQICLKKSCLWVLPDSAP